LEGLKEFSTQFQENLLHDLIDRMQVGTASEIVDALQICKYRLETQEFYKLCDKYKLYVAQDIVNIEFYKLNTLLNMYPHNLQFSQFLIHRFIEKLENEKYQSMHK
jgi:hypothetical protein